jgi:hypothetical protein
MAVLSFCNLIIFIREMIIQNDMYPSIFVIVKHQRHLEYKNNTPG